ncbi:hypothetical protein [Caldimonas brevitalea]|uniref:Uncharacterized protein n=1 Tax=Caldimonas brevitalea TaxID=413882 RepID=A0A0G3BHH4_9BURK|nr:hypothetical protein [Caldimonas brevitalea]AKJ28782.1 hypothetical protein AAW51_2091 [Caldimonas brevitalea]
MLRPLPTPRNAQAIVEARARGLRPADLVVVSLVGALDWSNPTVYADPAERYSWGWARGLDLIVAVKPGIAALRLLSDLLDVDPWSLCMADVQRQVGSNVYRGSYVSGTRRIGSYIATGPLLFQPWLPVRNKEFFA